YTILKGKEYTITALNFSSYGASLVHLDEKGEVVLPLYNYTKPLDEKIITSFYKKYGPEMDFSIKTGSSNSGMLNTGMQLYWLKYSKPEKFNQIRYSLHLPQYLSYIFTGIPLSEYTSIGCHTALWDYGKKDYHDWVYKEHIHTILPPIVSADTSSDIQYEGKKVKVGVGIHDSSAALLPYLRSEKKPFILVSTGTWSVVLNPFTEGLLTEKEVKNEGINYMQIDGKPVKSSRIFLGNEHDLQVKILSDHFHVSPDYHKTVSFDFDLFRKISGEFRQIFKWISLPGEGGPGETKLTHDTFDQAYHQLMIELVMLLVKSIEVVKGSEAIDILFVEGGFSDNDVFLKLLSYYLSDMELRVTNSLSGPALGAALLVSGTAVDNVFLKKHYGLQKLKPFS
ncbi:MAG: FGGY family carbohydrate kinase, partial [Cyclobacteriaceae bacterium]|nr:FGGY family carbohydrate kinase [Cyclobacteriaceae bacterium]